MTAADKAGGIARAGLDDGSDGAPAPAPAEGGKGRRPAWIAPAVATAGAILIGVAAVGGWAWSHYGSAAAAAAFLRGEALLLEPRTFDVGVLGPADEVKLEVRAWNLAREPIRLYGLNGFCATRYCVGSDERLPLAIEPGGEPRVLVLYARGRPGGEARPERFHYDMEVYTSIGNRTIAVEGGLPGD
jgi:hypothetical protein